MSHVDEGRLHAYLDGALPGGEAARREVEDHLAVCPDCRALSEAARVDRRGAGEILDLLQPIEIETPPFEDLVHRGEKVLPAPGSGVRGSNGPHRATGLVGGGRRNRRLASLAWAATVVVALGSGWVARGLLTSPGGQGRAGADVAAVTEPELESPAEAPTGASVDETSAETPVVGASAAPGAAVTAGPGDASAPGAAPAGTGPTDPAPEVEARAAERLAEAPPPEPLASVPTAQAEPQVAAAAAREREALDVLNAGGQPTSPPQAEARRADAASLADSDLALTSDPMARLLSTRASAATTRDAWVAATPAQAAGRLGTAPLVLDGIPWERMEVAEVDGLVLVRTVHPVGDGGLVELIQAPSGSDSREAVGFGLRQEELGRDPDPMPFLVSEQRGIALMLRGLENLEALESLQSLLR